MSPLEHGVLNAKINFHLNGMEDSIYGYYQTKEEYHLDLYKLHTHHLDKALFQTSTQPNFLITDAEKMFRYDLRLQELTILHDEITQQLQV